MTTRLFSGSDERPRPARNIEDAPAAMRVEFVDIAFSLAEQAENMNDEPSATEIYQVVGLTLGILNPAIQPHGGFRLRTQRYLIEAEWPRFYDVVLRLLQAFGNRRSAAYRTAVNTLFAAHGIAWELVNNRLQRVLPAAIATQVTAAIDELRRPGYESASELFNTAKDHFDARPRRDRDAATNAFDAMEAAAKIHFGLTNGTFGDALSEARRRNAFSDDVQQILRRLEVLRHHHLGHGGAEPFNLSSDEVDFVYVSSAAAARLFARL
jgi:hypothetical protein